MKLVSWNVNGIRSVVKKDDLQNMIKTLKPDIVCLQETKAERGQAEIDFPQYEEYWHSAKKKGYSGVAIFTKVKPLGVLLDFPSDIQKKFHLNDGYGDLTNEGRLLVLEFEEYFLVNVYTPNAKRDLARLTLREKHWDPAFLMLCSQLKKKKHVIMCGDFNAAHTPDDLARPKENEQNAGYTKEERAGVDKILASGFVDSFRLFIKGNGHYSWWSNFSHARERNIGWRIDYFFVDLALKAHVKHAKIHNDIFGSDHCPVSLEIRL